MVGADIYESMCHVVGSSASRQLCSFFDSDPRDGHRVELMWSFTGLKFTVQTHFKRRRGGARGLKEVQAYFEIIPI